jgi:hypothetical protein
LLAASLGSRSSFHVTVAADAWGIFWGGVLGGATVLVGVVTTEMLVRVRERRRRLNDSLWALRATANPYLRGPGAASDEAIQRDYDAVVAQLSQVFREARWPIRNARAIRAEVAEVYARFVVAIARAQTSGDPVRLGPVIGNKLHGLVLGTPKQTLDAKINEALESAGFPRLDEWPDDQDPSSPD